MFDLAKWIIVGLAVSGFIYNVIVTHAILKNDVKHLQKSVDELWKELNKIKNILIERGGK